VYYKITNELNIEEKLIKDNVIGVNLEIDHYKREIDKIETTYKIKQNKLIEEQSKNKKIAIIVLFLLLCVSCPALNKQPVQKNTQPSQRTIL